jgi:hypothetical protein
MGVVSGFLFAVERRMSDSNLPRRRRNDNLQTPQPSAFLRLPIAGASNHLQILSDSCIIKLLDNGETI